MTAATKSLITYLIFVVAGAVGLYGWNATHTPPQTHELSWVIFGAVAGITGLIHLWLLKAGSGDVKVFIRIFMTATSIKLLIYLMAIVLYALTNTEKAFVFTFHFLVFYFFFTAVEVILLYSHLKPKK
jgi:hypothetical protein